VTFGHTTTWPVGPYERFFGGAVQFGAAATTMRFAPGQLDQAIGPGQPELARYLAAHAERLIGDLPPPRASVVTQVRDVLARDLAVGIATQAEVARKLALSGRTLQRRLAEAGTTFQDVLDEVRASAARRLLRDRALAVSEVAFSLGYAELSSFYRAFRRWTGQTPIDWRAAAVS
jgi:AraC-like DNA-binding protein